MYGAELWFLRRHCKTTFKHFSVSYHDALKKIANIPRFYNNHFVCDILNVFTFNHCINLKMLKFFIRLKNSNSPCFNVHKRYFITHSNFAYFIEDNWKILMM